jgi:hypothetical protein
VIAGEPGPARGLVVRGDHLYWWGNRMDLRSGEIAAFPLAEDMAIDDRVAFQITGTNQVVALDLGTGALHTLLPMPIEDRITFSPSAFDETYVYFATDPGPRRPRDRAGLHRVRRDGKEAPERIAPAPGTYSPFTVHAGFAYYLGWIPQRRQQTLARVALAPGAAEETVALLLPRDPREPLSLQFAGGRVYYLDGDALWSAPLDRRANAIRQIDVPEARAVQDLVVVPPCAYWITKDAVRRARLDHGRPESIATVAAADANALATDGRHLYWSDGGRIRRAGRPGDTQALQGFRRPPPPAPPREVRSPAPSDPTAFGQPAWFNDGKPLPPGKYLLTYADGCLKYSSTQGWTVNADPRGGPSWWIIGATVADRRVVPPGTAGITLGRGAYARFDECVAASRHAPPEIIEHAGGVLGFWLDDSYYDDNVPGEAGRNPTWKLTPAAATATPTVQAGARPPDLSCRYPYGAAIVCTETPRELYVLSAINDKLRHFPDFAVYAAGQGIGCVRDCTTARRWATVYEAYARVHPQFDMNEPLELP